MNIWVIGPTLGLDQFNVMPRTSDERSGNGIVVSDIGSTNEVEQLWWQLAPGWVTNSEWIPYPANSIDPLCSVNCHRVLCWFSCGQSQFCCWQSYYISNQSRDKQSAPTPPLPPIYTLSAVHPWCAGPKKLACLTRDPCASFTCTTSFLIGKIWLTKWLVCHTWWPLQVHATSCMFYLANLTE